MSSKVAVLFVAVALVVFAPPAFAMGSGQGVTKIDFKLKIGDSTSSRLFAKLDVAAGIAQLTGGQGSANHALAGCTVNFSIGSAVFTGIADDKGKVTTPFNAKVTGNGAIMQIKANGLNLEQLFPIDPTDGDHQVTVALKVTAVKTNADGSTTTVTLNDQSVIFNYRVKKGAVKGRNF
jgi:hypothetical protein